MGATPIVLLLIGLVIPIAMIVLALVFDVVMIAWAAHWYWVNRIVPRLISGLAALHLPAYRVARR